MRLDIIEIVLRLVTACICGGFIGYERSLRQKEAGLRTHIILALGSALMMIVSKYGNYDLFDVTRVNINADRIAAQVVSGVGFLGAGVIFVRGGSIKGLTTAAGVWSTSGVGLAIGAGMYEAGIIATVFMVLAQIILHKVMPSSEMMQQSVISVTAEVDNSIIKDIETFLDDNNIQVVGVKIKKKDGLMQVDIAVRISKETSHSEIMKMMEISEQIKEVSFSS